MKRVFVLLLILFSTGCVNSTEYSIEDDKFSFYEVQIDESSYIFQYPSSGKLNSLGDKNFDYIDYDSCNIFFGNEDRYEEYLAPVKDKHELITESYDDEVRTYKAFYVDDLLVSYIVIINDIPYYFWIWDDMNGVKNCVYLLEEIADSFSEPVYHNQKYAFRVNLVPEYKIEYLPEEEGILMKKWVEEEIEDEGIIGHKVEFYFQAYDNFFDWKDLTDLIKDKYLGFEVEYVDHYGKNAIFINEGMGEYALRHFFFMSNNSAVIYEAYLKVESVHYNKYKDEFDTLVKTFTTL